jgi:hypothetical protein
MYCGISATLFDRLVADGRMPGPCRIDGRKVWDIRAIDVAFDDLPRDDASQRSSREDARCRCSTRWQWSAFPM